MKKIMYFPYGGGHGNIVKCLYKGLSVKPELEQKIIALTVSWRIFDENNIPYGRLSDYCDVIKEWDKIIKIGQKLAEAIEFRNPDLQYNDYCAYLGIGYYCLIHEYGEKEAEKKYAEIGRRAFCPVKVMKEILEHEKPDAVIITSGVRTERAVGIAANELKIPVIRIVDLHEFERSGCECYTCVMNEYAKKYAISILNEKPEHVYVTGQPVFEDNYRLDAQINLKIRSELQLDKYDKLIVYLEQPGLNETSSVENEIIRIAKEKPNWLFVIKQHPNQTDDLKNDICENIVSFRKYPLNYLLNNCDVAITRDSTAGLEAVLLDKPLINTALAETSNKFAVMDFDYSSYGISYKVTNLKDLLLAIETCLDNNSEIASKLKRNRTLFKNAPHVIDNIYQVLSDAWGSGNKESI